MRLTPFRIGGFLLLAIVMSTFGSKGNSQTVDAIDRSKCVSPNYDNIGGDLAVGQLVYVDEKSPTDDAELFRRYRTEILKILETENRIKHNTKLFLKSPIFFHFNRNFYKQMGAAVVCKKKFIHPSEGSRNRTYFFFRFHEPKELAKIIINDIANEKSVVRKCLLSKASGSPRK